MTQATSTADATRPQRAVLCVDVVSPYAFLLHELLLRIVFADPAPRAARG